MVKRKEDQEPKIVNHRWHLPSLDEILDHALPRWGEGQHPDFSGPDGYDRLRAALHRFAQDSMWQLSFSLEKAAAKGIEQALQLIRDPEYHKTVKRRTKRAMERHEQFMAKQQAERERYQRGELTLVEKLHAIGQVTYSIQYHEKELQKLR